jgi:hypothetical protein
MRVINHATPSQLSISRLVAQALVTARMSQCVLPDSCAAHDFAFQQLHTDQLVQSFEMLVAVIVGSLLFYSTWSFVALEINHRRAASMKRPLVRLPIDPLNILF